VAVEIPDTLTFLLGAWAIERTINDHRDADTVRFHGIALVQAAPTGALYTETGQVSTPHHSGPARRTLLLSPHEDGTVGVNFRDGRPFLDLDLSSGAARATHPCRADRYEMSFAVLGADELVECWRVTGPAKNYRAVTRWRRRVH
jgi:hypothetical protein